MIRQSPIVDNWIGCHPANWMDSQLKLWNYAKESGVGVKVWKIRKGR
jgi:hypothetical protein